MKTREKTRIFRLQIGPREPEINEIPCIFPDDQGIECGEQFASDCIIHQPITDFRRVSGAPVTYLFAGSLTS
jgi:hypothetical protein